jgi:hypothetical protein
VARKPAPDIYFEPESRRKGRPGRTGRFIRNLTLIVIGGACAAAAVLFISPEARRALGMNTPAGEAAQTEPVTVPDDNLIGKQAQEWGVARCLGRVVFLSQFLTQGTTANWLLTRGQNNPDAELFSATIIAHEQATGLRGISNFHVAPVANGGCNTAYESTLYYAGTCAQTHERIFPAFTQPVELGSEVAQAFTMSDGTGRLFLMPAGETGCVAVKSEIFY